MVGVGRECVCSLLRQQGTGAPLLVYGFLLIRRVQNSGGGGAMFVDQAESKRNRIRRVNEELMSWKSGS